MGGRGIGKKGMRAYLQGGGAERRDGREMRQKGR